ncbi:MAG: peptide ABC transporter substrate-binding protein, partial [Candidatus Eremiobacteraeota bacterium]|nr:peptide ABC transporter substrate-binding protein [Candidatus Eremiobacteraeota bacterium]
MRLRLGLLAASLLWVSCPGLASPDANERTLRVALTQEPSTLNPVVGTLAVETDVAQLIFSGLTRYDERGNRVPDLAEAVPSRANGGISADGRTLTYHLLHNAQWQDGVPLTSEDVKFTFEAQMNPKNNVPNRLPYDEIARVETPDKYTVRIVLKRPWAPALDGFSDRTAGAIIPAHLLAKYEDLNHVDFGSAPVGSGPYRLVAWRRGSEMTFEADPHFYRAAPKIKHVQIRFLTNDSTMMIALRTHELDLADRLNISTWLSLGTIPGMLPAINAQTSWEHLTFNTGRPPLDDRRVRLALCYGFNVRELYAKIAHGLGLLGPTSQSPATIWYNRKLGYYPFDPAKARKLLDEAGWKPGPDGIRVKDGKRLSLTFVSTTGNITREQTEVILQQRWRALGIDVVIKNGPAAMVFALAANGGPIYSGNYDVALSAFLIPTPDPTTRNFNGEDRIPPLGNNLSFYRNRELTQLEEAAASTFDERARKRMYDRIQEIEL